MCVRRHRFNPGRSHQTVFATSRKEFIVNAIAAAEARESSLARRLKHRQGVYRGAGAVKVGRDSSAVEQRSYKAEVVSSTLTLATTDSSVG